MMTYAQLNKIKTTGFTTNHVIDDIVNNARYGWGKNFGSKEVEQYEINKIMEWAAKEGVNLPFPVFCEGCGGVRMTTNTTPQGIAAANLCKDCSKAVMA